MHRVAPLDGIRGIAILMVLIVHLFPMQPESTITLVIARATGLFWLGVDLFFVLSGYLITGILLRSRGRPGYYRSFLMRRTFRIFPAYFLVLGFVFFVLPLVHAPLADSGLGDLWPWFVTYLQNWPIALQGDSFPWPGVNHFWSLAIEEQFYVAWPLVVALFAGARLRALCVAIILGSFLLRAGLYFTGAHWTFLYTSTVTRLDGLAAGALIATLSSAQARALLPFAKWVGLGALAVLMLLSALGGGLYSEKVVTVALAAATLAFGALLLATHADALPQRAQRLLAAPSLRWLGLYSYGLYLLHYVLYWPIHTGLDDLLPGLREDAPNRFVLICGMATLIATLAAAWAMFRYFEEPLLRLRDRLQPAAPVARVRS